MSSRFLHNHQHAANGGVVIEHWTVAVRPPHVLEAAVALDGYEVILVPHRLGIRQDPLDFRADDGPDRGPVLPPLSPERGDVAPGRSEARQVAVIEELHQLRSPPEEHWVGRRQHRRDGGAQAVRPGRDRTELSRGPVKRAAACSHHSAGRESALLCQSRLSWLYQCHRAARSE